MSKDKHSSLEQVEAGVWTKQDYNNKTDWVACEIPVALIYNCLSYAVMMASPEHLEDFALGFSLSEGILSSAEQMLDIEIVKTEQGATISMIIAEKEFNALKKSTRNMIARTSCGLCGKATLEQTMIKPPKVDQTLQLTHKAIQAALKNLTDTQVLNKKSGSYHGAAWCDLDGEVLLIREDVGRHNALDKCLGALEKSDLSKQGFLLVTSRLSYEMVTKAAFRNIQCLVGVSAATALAINYANDCGLTLVGFARPDRHVVYTCEERIM